MKNFIKNREGRGSIEVAYGAVRKFLLLEKKVS